MGGITPKASAVSIIIFFGWLTRSSIVTFGINSKGYAPLVFSVIVPSSKSSLPSSFKIAFSITEVFIFVVS